MIGGHDMKIYQVIPVHIVNGKAEKIYGQESFYFRNFADAEKYRAYYDNKSLIMKYYIEEIDVQETY